MKKTNLQDTVIPELVQNVKKKKFNTEIKMSAFLDQNLIDNESKICLLPNGFPPKLHVTQKVQLQSKSTEYI